MFFTETWKTKESRTSMIKEAIILCVVAIGICVYLIIEQNKEVEQLHQEIRTLETRFTNIFGG